MLGGGLDAVNQACTRHRGEKVTDKLKITLGCKGISGIPISYLAASRVPVGLKLAAMVSLGDA